MAHSLDVNDSFIDKSATTIEYDSGIASDICDLDGFSNHYDNESAYLGDFDTNERLNRSCEAEFIDSRVFNGSDDSHRFSSLPEESIKKDPIAENCSNSMWSTFNSKINSYFSKTSHSSLESNNALIQEEDSNSDWEKGKIKNKCLSTWNNMTNGWIVRTKVDFKRGSKIVLLGKEYICHYRDREFQMQQKKNGKKVLTPMDIFVNDFTSKFWFTYRQNFKSLMDSNITSDVGWGCMLRTGQMMMAQAFVMHLLGRDWSWSSTQNDIHFHYHRKIVSMFAEHLHPDKCYSFAPFSLHKLVELGQNNGKELGDWYGPASVAYVLREALNQVDESFDRKLAQLRMYIAQDCTVYLQDILDLCTRSNNNATDQDIWHPLILVIPIRLGGVKMNEVYTSCVKNMLTHDLCLGFVGGKPKHSVYFIGFQEDRLIYLDPHYCQDTVDVTEENFKLESFHCMSPRKLNFSKMDPSCTVAFFLRTRKELDRFVSDAPKMAMTSAPYEKGLYPLFVCSTGRNADLNYEESVNEKYLRIDQFDKNGQLKSKNVDSDDFVLL